ncbi:hypothetical protein LIER_37797 [Lithospermum erythrorhizon]|uniref:Uncharacterized protein n=1 Tax=Lithospermum erythrorhizon TaxID=34254 RepID=A0AAV3PQM3_LITER
MGSKGSLSAPSSSKGEQEELTSIQGAPEAYERLEAPTQEKPSEEPLDSPPVQCIWYPGKPHQERPSSPHRSPDPSMGFMPIGSEEGYKSDHSYFVDTPYVLPSGVEVTADSVCRPDHCLAADMLKNCMLRALGAWS